MIHVPLLSAGRALLELCDDDVASELGHAGDVVEQEDVVDQAQEDRDGGI